MEFLHDPTTSSLSVPVTKARAGRTGRIEDIDLCDSWLLQELGNTTKYGTIGLCEDGLAVLLDHYLAAVLQKSRYKVQLTGN